MLAPIVEHLQCCLLFAAIASRTSALIAQTRRFQVAWFSATLHFGTWDLILYLGFGAWGLELAGATAYRPSGVETSVPGGGVNSNVDGGNGARVWFEYVVTIR